jgi:hypothetical protein
MEAFWIGLIITLMALVKMGLDALGHANFKRKPKMPKGLPITHFPDDE